MANLSEAIARVCSDYLGRPEDEIGATVGREIQAAIDHYASERFGFNERRLNLTLTFTSVYSLNQIVAGNQTREQRVEGSSSNPTTVSWYAQYYHRIIAVDNVIITRGGGNLVMLEPVSWDEMCRYRREHTAQNTTQGQGLTSVPTIWGDPSLYTVYGDALWLDISPPSPSTGAWSITGYLDCHVEFTKLADGTTTNPFLDEGYELICARAARMTAMKPLREYEHAAQFANLEGEALNALRERGHHRMATGRLVPRL